MAALDHTQGGAAEEQQDSRGKAGPARQIALEQRDQAMRGFTFERWSASGATKAQPLAQQYDRANGSGLQVSLGPQRSQRSSEASCTIHCTSSSNVARKRLRVLAQVTSR